ADEIVEACQVFATHVESLGTSVVIAAGTRMRGNDEVVQANPDFFLPAGATHQEIEQRVRDLYRSDSPRPPAQPVATIVPPLRDEDAVVPCATVIGVPEGRKLPKDDPAVEQQPDRFVPVAGKGLTRENAVAALATLTHTNAAGETRT